jgi:hypothetical protein
VSGEDHVFQGNNVSNVDGHVIRMSDMNRINVSNNDFTNPNETSGYRGTLTIHSGSYAYVRNNNLNDGWFSVGPLGNADGLAEKGSRFNWSVFENNTVNRSRFIVLHWRRTTRCSATTSSRCSTTTGASRSRVTTRVRPRRDDVEDHQQHGDHQRDHRQLPPRRRRSQGITLANNLFLAPKLITGTSGAAPVFVYDSDLLELRQDHQQRLGDADDLKYAEGGINYVWPNWSNAAGYKTPAEWNAIWRGRHRLLRGHLVQLDHAPPRPAARTATPAPSGRASSPIAMARFAQQRRLDRRRNRGVRVTFARCPWWRAANA